MSEHTRITELIMADVLDGIEHCFGEGGVDAVVGFALARNRSRESDKLMDELEAAFGEPPALPTPGSRLQAAISLWHRFGDSNVEEWEDETHKAEYLDAIDGLASGWLFNILLSRINFDGMDPRTFSLAELQRAIVGAEWPPRIPAAVGNVQVREGK
jgi:hypothetical protein